MLILFELIERMDQIFFYVDDKRGNIEIFDYLISFACET